mgnify:CR=1 FL=1|jgi:hypothetical protein|tara:strand:+ start:185 stop:421 length:237 start_codon:yes stop_codon:yes gene_type:complete
MGEMMDRMMNMLMDLAGQLTNLAVALVGLGVALAVVFGSGVPFVGDILTNLIDLVNMLGENGIVGLVILGLLMSLYSR